MVFTKHTLNRSTNVIGNHPTLFFFDKEFDRTRTGMLILNHLIENNCPQFRDGLLDSYFFKLTLGSDCLELRLWEFAFKTITNSVILQIYQLLSNKSFQQYTEHMPSLFFGCSSLTFTTQKANACM